MSDVIDQKTADKIRKLLGLAQSNNEHEAASAMSKAQELMAEHNITMAVLEAKGEKSEGGAREQSRVVGRALYQYQRRLMSSIAEANFCLCWLRETTEVQGSRAYKRKGYTLIGRQSNVIATQIMFDYLNEVLERLVPITSNAQRLSKFAISWKEGCADSLRARIDDRRYEMRQESERKVREAETAAKHPSAAKPEPGALMLLSDLTKNEYELNCDYMYGYEPGTTTRRRLEREAHRAVAMVDPTPAEPPKPLTASEKEKQDRASKKWREKWERQNHAFWARKDMSAYQAGSKVGETVSLDKQVKHDPLKKIGG